MRSQICKMDFITEDPWRVFRIMSEFVDGFEALSPAGPAKWVFFPLSTRRGKP